MDKIIGFDLKEESPKKDLKEEKPGEYPDY